MAIITVEAVIYFWVRHDCIYDVYLRKLDRYQHFAHFIEFRSYILWILIYSWNVLRRRSLWDRSNQNKFLFNFFPWLKIDNLKNSYWGFVRRLNKIITWLFKQSLSVYIEFLKRPILWWTWDTNSLHLYQWLSG